MRGLRVLGAPYGQMQLGPAPHRRRAQHRMPGERRIWSLWSTSSQAATRKQVRLCVRQRVSEAPRGHGGSRPDWFTGMPMKSLLAEGTPRAIFEIVEAPVVSVDGRKVQGIVFTDPGSNMNFITHKLAHQLQLEGARTKIFMKRVDEEYTEREVKVYRLGVEDAKR